MLSIARRNINKYFVCVVLFRKFVSTLKLSETTKSSRTLSTSAEFLLTAENRNRCVERMRKAPPVGLKLNQSPNESAFASVLIPVCVDSQGEASILYTRRSGQLSRHVRQISFPGGLKDPTDVDFIACALRETEEEIGLHRDRIDVWGTGSLLNIPRTAAIMPVFGTIQNFNLAELKLNTDEVEEAFTVPIAKLNDPRSLHHTQFKTGYSSPVFIVGKYKIWGITGYITLSFLHCFIPSDRNHLKNHVKFIRPYKQSK